MLYLQLNPIGYLGLNQVITFLSNGYDGFEIFDMDNIYLGPKFVHKNLNSRNFITTTVDSTFLFLFSLLWHDSSAS